MNCVEKLSFTYCVKQETKLYLPNKFVKDMVESELACKIANFILENIDDLPIEYEFRTQSDTRVDEHRLSFYIISEKELERLEDIERRALEQGGLKDI